MRQNAKRSSRGKGQQKKNSKTRVYESNGPDAKIRGTAYQITEKYELLAKDAETSGNHVLAENYRQHGEHYQRIINMFEEEEAKTRQTFEIKDRDLEEDVESVDLAEILPEAVIAADTAKETGDMAVA